VVASAIPGVDRILEMKGDWRETADWLALMRTGYDYCFDLTRTDRSALLTLLSRATNRSTYERTRFPSKWRPLLYNHFTGSSVRYSHTIDHHLAFLRALGIDHASTEIKLALPSEAKVRAARLLKGEGITGPFVIFHPGTARREKFWVAERWAEVIDHCASGGGLTRILTSGRAGAEQSHLGKIKKQLRHPAIDLSGKTDLMTLAALIEKARLLVAVDSAPTHLAAASLTPQVVLYGPTNPFHWRPRHACAVILQGGASEPLTEFSPNQPRHAMKEISTAQVIDAMESLLSTPAASVS
jgi:ADP-heptose:LPS heptosyltransferase